MDLFTNPELFVLEIPLFMTIAFFIIALAMNKVLKRTISEKSVGFNLSLMTAFTCITAAWIGGVSDFYMNQVGTKIEGITRFDIPLTRKLVDFEINQLSRAVWIERMLLYNAKGLDQETQGAVIKVKDMTNKTLEHPAV